MIRAFWWPVSQEIQDRVYAFGEFRLDLGRGSLQRDGADIPLRPQSFAVLQILVENHGQLITKAALHDKVWGDTAVTADSLTQCLTDIRRAVADRDRTVVRTVPKRGYIFDAEVSQVPPDSRMPTSASRWRAAALIALLFTAIGLTWYFTPDDRIDSATPGVRSIAVLPFIDMSDAQDQRFFGEGLSEELINLLSRSTDLRVIARASAFSAADGTRDIDEIAKRLNVDYVLDGSVRRSGERLRISAQLVNASDSSHLWSETYDRTIGDIFNLQGDVAGAVANALHTVLRAHTRETGSTNPDSHVLVLQARSLLHTLEPDDNAMAVELLERAVEIDPGNADAFVQLARAIYHRREAFGSPEHQAAWLRSNAMVEMALSNDPEHPAANAWQGWFELHYNHDFENAARLYERAMLLDPTNLDTIRFVVNAGIILGDLNDAVELAKYLVERDPLCLGCFDTLQLAAYLAGDVQEAEEAVRRLLFLTRDRGQFHGDLGRILLAKGDAVAALEAYQRMNDGGASELLGQAIALHRLGRTRQFETVFRQLRDSWGEIAPSHIAQVQAETGDIDGAFESLARHAALAPWRRGINYRSEFYRNLHGDPRWNRYLEQIGLSVTQREAIGFKVVVPR